MQVVYLPIAMTCRVDLENNDECITEVEQVTYK